MLRECPEKRCGVVYRWRGSVNVRSKGHRPKGWRCGVRRVAKTEERKEHPGLHEHTTLLSILTGRVHQIRLRAILAQEPLTRQAYHFSDYPTCCEDNRDSSAAAPNVCLRIRRALAPRC
nr:hypothetical protein CFP56_77200 [Quercus suber]